MTWFRVDDSLADHPKTIDLQERKGWEQSFSLWLLGGSHCAKHLTDGVINLATIKRLGFAAKTVLNLVASGFWETTDRPDVWQYHDWFDWQPSREEVIAQREANASRQQAYREKKQRERDATCESQETSRVSNALRDTPLTHLVTTPRPVPSRPVPSLPNQVAEAEPPAATRDDLVWLCGLAERLSRGEIEPTTLLRRGEHHDAAQALFVMARRAATKRDVDPRTLVELVFQRWLTPERARIRKGWVVALHDDWPAQLLELDDEIKHQQALAGDAHA